jgi:hypothetical protein
VNVNLSGVRNVFAQHSSSDCFEDNGRCLIRTYRFWTDEVDLVGDGEHGFILLPVEENLCKCTNVEFLFAVQLLDIPSHVFFHDRLI